MGGLSIWAQGQELQRLLVPELGYGGPIGPSPQPVAPEASGFFFCNINLQSFLRVLITFIYLFVLPNIPGNTFIFVYLGAMFPYNKCDQS